MHPALSVILFTTLSGAGFGLLFWLGLWPSPPDAAFGWVAAGSGFALAVGGLAASTFHLGRPERAWRAFGQWRSSWLSREGVLSVAALLVLGLFAAFWLFRGERVWPLGWFGAALAAATVHATGMIYAQLRTVRLWNTWLTPAVYLLLAASGGLLGFSALRAGFGLPAPIMPALLLLLAAWGAKLLWWRRGADQVALTTPETATGLGAIGRVRLLEPPHTGSNYLLDEMGFRVARRRARALERVALGLGGALPALLMLAAMLAPGPSLWLGAAFVAHLIGVLAERWLFFAEARHVVMNYYDRRTRAPR